MWKEKEKKWNKVINKKKVVTMSLLTALITTLMFLNLNVTSVAAGPGTMTFNSNVTMEFETGNYTWFSPGVYMGCYNGTNKFANITKIEPGVEFQVDARPGWDLVTPESDQWWQIYTPQLYGLYIAFKVDDIYGPPGSPIFNISDTYGYWPGAPMNFTIDPPLTYFEAELMQPSIETGVTYMAFTDYGVYNALPTVGSWWNVTEYPGPAVNVAFHINYTESYWNDPATGDDYYYVQFDELRNATGHSVDKIDSLYTPELPIEGIEAVQLITEIDTVEYYISSPACLLPEDSWWNITYPDDLDGTQFHVDSSEKRAHIAAFRSYMHIDNINGSTTITSPGVVYIEAIWADAPKVSTIGSWYNVIDGPTPDVPSCWNITAPEELKNITFCIDIAGEYVFRIDEVVNATSGESGPVSLTTPATSITAEELTPKIWIEEADTVIKDATPGVTNYTISIKTDYIFHAWSYELTLEWNPKILSCVGVTNGDLFAAGVFENGTVDNVNGKLSLTAAYFSYSEPPAPQVHAKLGNRTLANVAFKVMCVYGESDITLGDETKLVGVTKDGNGIMYNAIDDVTGDLEHGLLRLRPIGDVDNDGTVNVIDILLCCVNMGPVPPKPPECDMNGDGSVNVIDILLCCVNMGPCPY